MANYPYSTKMLNVPEIDSCTGRSDFTMLPQLEDDHAVISRQGGWKFRLHSYVAYFNDRYWCMWSQGRCSEDRHGQHVVYSTSPDGLNWSEPKALVEAAPNGFRYFARGFWKDRQIFRALVAYDEVGGYFGKSLSLQSYIWDSDRTCWMNEGWVFKNTISNFPPKQLPVGSWMLARRDANRNLSFLIGGNSLNDCQNILFSGYKLKDIGWLDEPDWSVLPDNRLVCLFRDNRKSGYLLRSFSDSGYVWSLPEITNFPNATSKFNLIHISRGYYLLVNNVHPRCGTLCLSLSYDGLVFTKMFRLSIPDMEVDENRSRELFQYPHMIEQDGHLIIVFSRRKQTVEVLKISLDKLDALK